MSMERLEEMTRGEWLVPPWRNAAFRGMAVDSRAVRRRNAFVCLPGERTDGHQFARSAVEAGAALVISDRRRWNSLRRQMRPLDSRVAILGVDDPLTAMGELTAAVVAGWPTRFVAVTGSVGKTTAKEMIAAVLGAAGPVFKSPGNYNNLIGIPLAVFGARRVAPRAVLEFGMSTPGEIAGLTRMIRPAVGVVTTIGAAHLENLQSVNAIARAKRELFDHMDSDGVAVLNADDPIQRRWARTFRRRVVTYAGNHDADLTADRVDSNRRSIAFRLNRRHAMRVPVGGAFNVANALAACAVGRVCGLSYRAIAEGLAKTKVAGGRFSTQRVGGVTVIDDSYNANPLSMRAALEELTASAGTGRRIAVLAGMHELGKDSKRLHEEVGAWAAGIDVLVTVGRMGRWIDAGAAAAGMPSGRRLWTRDARQARAAIGGLVQRRDVVLFKGSRAEQVDELAAWFVARLRGGERSR